MHADRLKGNNSARILVGLFLGITRRRTSRVRLSKSAISFQEIHFILQKHIGEFRLRARARAHALPTRWKAPISFIRFFLQSGFNPYFSTIHKSISS